jgi:glycerol-3-phosphate dehydrogenase (NAD(P)+)
MSDAKTNGHAPQRIPVSVIGGGAWGRALALSAANAGHDVLLYTRRADVAERGVRVTQRLADVGAHAHLILMSVPSPVVVGIARELGDHLDGRHAIVHGVRGLVPRKDGALDTIASVLREETPVRRVGALGGPALTEELHAGAPSVLVVASRYPEVIAATQRALTAPSVRVYATDDLLGLEWASALTGLLAVAVGFARGSGIGAGLVSAFMTRGIHECARIAAAAGAEERTFLGLAGFGDLFASIGEEARPEIRLGEALARAASLDETLASIDQRIEAVELAPLVARFAESRKVKAPIVHAIAYGLLARERAEDLVHKLMVEPVTHSA